MVFIESVMVQKIGPFGDNFRAILEAILGGHSENDKYLDRICRSVFESKNM